MEKRASGNADCEIVRAMGGARSLHSDPTDVPPIVDADSLELELLESVPSERYWSPDMVESSRWGPFDSVLAYGRCRTLQVNGLGIT